MGASTAGPTGERLKRLEALVALALSRTATSASEGETVVRIPFTFSSSSPLELVSVAAGAAVNRCALVITTPFSDPAATLQVGTASSPALLLAAGDNVPSSPGQYESDAIVVFASADNVVLTIAPGSSSAGAGFVLLKEK